VSAPIPDAHAKSTLVYGWYSNRTRGSRKQHGLRAKAGLWNPAADSDGSPVRAVAFVE
jgi:hypothetical protein